MQYKLKINNELLGILYMLLCQFSFATNDAFVKFVYQSYEEIFVLNQIIFIRGIFTLLFILFFLYIKKELDFKKMFCSKELRVRGFLESLAALFFFIGIALLPFAKVFIKYGTNFINCIWGNLFKRKSQMEKMECCFIGICWCSSCN